MFHVQVLSLPFFKQNMEKSMLGIGIVFFMLLMFSNSVTANALHKDRS